MLPLPFYANSVEDRAVFLAQRGVSTIMEMGVDATLRIVGIGTMEGDASILSTGMVEPEEFAQAANGRLNGQRAFSEFNTQTAACRELMYHCVNPAACRIAQGFHARKGTQGLDKRGQYRAITA